MIRPPFLSPGDTVGIVAPGRKITHQEIKAALQILHNWELNIVLGDNLFNNTHSYLSALDNERLSDLQSMLDNSSIKAILCARGGYGCSRIIDRLDFSHFLESPKWIVGFSDVTAIHLKLFSFGIETMHATMPILFGHEDSTLSVQRLRQALFGEEVIIKSTMNQSNKAGIARGRTVGGNLSLLIDSIGTSSEFNTNGLILIIEEIEEYRYKIDRMMTHLKRAGKLSGLAGLVVGHMTDIMDSSLGFGESVEEIILDKVRDYTYPVAFGFPTGHENPNFAWKHGAVMELSVQSSTASLRDSK